MNGNDIVQVVICRDVHGYASIDGNIDVGINGTVDVTTTSDFLAVDVKKPYLINLNQIECIVGEWDKDKATYGVRVFFASGNSVWCGGDSAREFLNSVSRFDNRDDLLKKFDDCASKRKN